MLNNFRFCNFCYLIKDLIILIRLFILIFKWILRMIKNGKLIGKLAITMRVIFLIKICKLMERSFIYIKLLILTYRTLLNLCLFMMLIFIFTLDWGLVSFLFLTTNSKAFIPFFFLLLYLWLRIPLWFFLCWNSELCLILHFFYKILYF